MTISHLTLTMVQTWSNGALLWVLSDKDIDLVAFGSEASSDSVIKSSYVFDEG